MTCFFFPVDQVNVLKTIRFLQHSKYASSRSPGHPTPKEAWTTRAPSSLTSRSSTLSQRSSSSADPVCKSMNKSKYLGMTCVRHVIQHCGGYLLDSLAPPVPSTLGRTTLMVLREAVVNGEVRWHQSKGKVLFKVLDGFPSWLVSVLLNWLLLDLGG